MGVMGYVYTSGKQTDAGFLKSHIPGSAQKFSGLNKNNNMKTKNGVTVTYHAFPLRTLQVAFGNVAALSTLI